MFEPTFSDFSGTCTRMPVTKSCPSCQCVVNIRKLICPSCGHVLRNHKPEAAKRRTLKRACTAVETADQADERRRRDRLRAARKRAMETADQADERRKLNRHCAAKKRAIETAYQADERRKLNRHCAARKRGVETADQADERRKLNRHCAARKRAVGTTDQNVESLTDTVLPEREL